MAIVARGGPQWQAVIAEAHRLIVENRRGAVIGPALSRLSVACDRDRWSRPM